VCACVCMYVCIYIYICVCMCVCSEVSYSCLIRSCVIDACVCVCKSARITTHNFEVVFKNVKKL